MLIPIPANRPEPHVVVEPRIVQPLPEAPPVAKVAENRNATEYALPKERRRRQSSVRNDRRRKTKETDAVAEASAAEPDSDAVLGTHIDVRV